MKLIFLDFDGVLNSRQSEIYFSQTAPETEMEARLCPIATSNLRHILKEHPDTKIVVSSTWRRNRTEEQLGEILGQFGIDPQVVIGKTPYYGPGEVRGLRIQEWLDENPEIKPPSHFVIIDDDSDMAHFLGTEHFIKTNSKTGLMYKEVSAILAYFGDYNLKYAQLVKGEQYRLFSKPKQVEYTFDGVGFYYLDNNGDKRDNIHFYPETEKFCWIKKSI